MNTEKTIPVLLLTGYLGSGKTTLLNRILNNRKGIRFAVIVNDIGEVNIDADLIAKGGIVGNDDDSLVALQNGCICCTLKMDLVKQLCDLKAAGIFDYIVIEASGICEPEPIAQTVCALPQLAPEQEKDGHLRLDCIATVVDALRLKEEFNKGESLMRKDLDEEDIENLIIQQIEFCNIIILNKISEITREEADEIKRIIRAIQPKAEIIECDYCNVPLERLIDTNLFDFEDVATSATWIREIEAPLDELESEHDREKHHHEHEHEHDHHHEHEHDHHHEHEHEHHHEHEHEHGHHHHHHHDGEGEAEEYGISTFVYYARRPFSLNKFDWFCAKEWPAGVIRTKGLCYFKENPDMSYLFEQAGSRKQLMEAGRWYATAPEEDLQAMLARDPGLMRDWDPEYGDRMQKLVFIGKNMDKEGICRKLDSLLD
ncbi:MAG: GTP-binding protein [Muribaculaceae bacterium]|nr:GTP-binding protein [Muribaculaceae bacterium]